MGLQAKLCHSNTQRENSDFCSNFTKLFLLSWSAICTIIYFTQTGEYGNRNGFTDIPNVDGRTNQAFSEEDGFTLLLSKCEFFTCKDPRTNFQLDLLPDSLKPVAYKRCRFRISLTGHAIKTSP